jgi:hypothetical protein
MQNYFFLKRHDSEDEMKQRVLVLDEGLYIQEGLEDRRRQIVCLYVCMYVCMYVYLYVWTTRRIVDIKVLKLLWALICRKQ